MSNRKTPHPARAVPALGALIVLAMLLSVSSCQQGCPVGNALFSNFLPIQVGPTSSTFPAPNVPMVSVTICVPGTTNCQTIDNIDVDTGSTGLRIFSSVLTVNLPTEQSAGNPVAECASFGSGNTWGSVASASVTLGGEPAVTVPVQIINSSFGTTSPPAPCDSFLISVPGGLGANGLLGIMPTQSDSIFTEYFTCQSGTCSFLSSPGAQAVQNPVFLLPQDNNGVTVYLNAISDQGASQGVGAVVLGVSTEPNNDPNFISSGNAYECVNSSSFDFTTNYASQSLAGSFVDTGSNMYFFQDPNITQCTVGIFTTLYCPSSVTGKSATVVGNSGTPQNVNFLVGNGSALIGSGNSAFDDLGAPMPLSGLGFDWGLPFFFGRSVFIAYGPSSSAVCGSGGITANMWGFAPLPQTPSSNMQRILEKARQAQRQNKH